MCSTVYKREVCICICLTLRRVVSLEQGRCLSCFFVIRFTDSLQLCQLWPGTGGSSQGTLSLFRSVGC